MQKRIILGSAILLLISLLLAACGDNTPQTLPVSTPTAVSSIATSTPAATVASNTATATPTSAAATTPTATPAIATTTAATTTVVAASPTSATGGLFGATSTPSVTRPVTTPAVITGNSVSLKLRGTTPAQFGHTSIITDIAYSPDGKMFASASADSTIKLWDSATNKEIKTLYGHTRGVQKIAFSPDGKMLASIGYDNKLLLWNLATDRFTLIYNKADENSPISFSADSKTLAITDMLKAVQLIDVASAKVQPYLGAAQFIIFSPDGKTRAVVSDEQSFVLEPANGGTPIKEFITDYLINDLAFSQDATTIAVATNGGVEIWAAATGQRIGHFIVALDDQAQVKFSPDGKSLISISDSSRLQIISVPAAEVLDSAGITSVKAASFSPDGKTLALVLDKPAIELVKLVGNKFADLKVNQPIYLEGSNYYPGLVNFSDDGKTILVGKSGYDKYIQQLDPTTAKLTVVLNERSLYLSPYAFSPDNKLVASRSSANLVKLVDTTSGTTIQEIKTDTLTSTTDPTFTGAMAFTPDSKILVTGHFDHNVRVWEVATGKLLYTLSDHKENISVIAVSADGKMAASGDWYGNISVWQLATGKLVANLEGHLTAVHSLAFSPDGTKLLSGATDFYYLGKAELKSWDIVSGKELASLHRVDLGVDGLVYLLGGHFLIAIGEDSHIRILDSATLKEVFNIPSSQIAKAKALSLSPDGKLLVTAHVDGSIKLWDIISN